MKKILVIGGNGSGKTTFAKALSNKMNIPVVHLDKLYWKDNWKHVTSEEFDKKLLPELLKDTWIIDGNMKRTLPMRLKYCDTVIIFDFPRTICLWGAIKRTLKNYGKSRDDMGGYCPEKISPGFYKNIWCNNRKMLETFYDIIGKEKNIKTIVFKKRKDVNNFLSHCNVSNNFC